MVPAMISCFLPVSFTACTKSGLSQALISPLRATYLACGAFWWISGISGPFGPCGTEAVVMTGIFASVAIFASVEASRRSVVNGMSCTVWNRPLWWSINSMATLSGSITGFAPLKLAAYGKAFMAGISGEWEATSRCAGYADATGE
ncbi:hypothetical protein D3C81_1519000 [compost metagenome]